MNLFFKEDVSGEAYVERMAH